MSHFLNAVQPYVSAIKKHAQDTGNEAAMHDLKPFLKDSGYLAPECYVGAVMTGIKYKYKGIYEICTTHFADDPVVEALYSEI